MIHFVYILYNLEALLRYLEENKIFPWIQLFQIILGRTAEKKLHFVSKTQICSIRVSFDK